MSKKKTDRALGMDKDISRRDFLNGVGVAVGVGTLVGDGVAVAQGRHANIRRVSSVMGTDLVHTRRPAYPSASKSSRRGTRRFRKSISSPRPGRRC